MQPQQSNTDAKEIIDDMVSHMTESEDNHQDLNKVARKLMMDQLEKNLLNESLPADEFVDMDKYDLRFNNEIPQKITNDNVKRIYSKNEEVNLPSKIDEDGNINIGKNNICGINDGENAIGCIACKVDYGTPENLVNQNETNTNIIDVCKYGHHKGKDLPSREQCTTTCSGKPDKFQ